jgi:hypothetical protein
MSEPICAPGNIVSPWSPEDRARRKRKLDREVRRVCERIGVKHVYLVAFYDAGDGKHTHTLDSGSLPMPLDDFFRNMLAAYEIMKANQQAEAPGAMLAERTKAVTP